MRTDDIKNRILVLRVPFNVPLISLIVLIGAGLGTMCPSSSQCKTTRSYEAAPPGNKFQGISVLHVILIVQCLMGTGSWKLAREADKLS